jgi:protein associated with RNAse G/E
MAVKFTKPEINVREKLAELEKPSGIAGEAMLRAETPQEQQALIGVGRRNMIINGDFQVWQRGTSFSSGFTADRWYTAAGTVTKDGLAIKHVATNTDPYLLYKVEDLGNKFDGQDAIASFYLKTSSGINKLQYLTVCNVNYTHDVMYELPSEIEGYTRWACPVKLTNAHTDYIRIVVELEAVSGNTSYLRQFQLELGKVATPFEHRPYGEELALCQRYYYKRNATVNGDRFCAGNASSTTDFRGFINLPVNMRASPSFETSGVASHFSIVTGTNGVVTCNDLLTAGISVWGGLINAETASGLTAGHGGQIRASSTSAYIAFDAEL